MVLPNFTHPVMTASDVVVPIRMAPDLPLLFVFHPLSGLTFCYMNFVKHLDGKFSVYGVQAVGLDGQRQPYSCIESMAAHYAFQLQGVLKEAKVPVIFAGFSFGGNVALETAAQLLSMGTKISCVALLDSHKVFARSISRKLTDIETFFLFVNEMETILGRRVSISSKDLLEVGPYQQCILLEDSLGQEFVGMMSPLLRVYRSNMAALAQHASKDYSGKVIYFRAVGKDHHETDQEGLLLGPSTSLVMKDVDVDHNAMLSEPFVQEVASIVFDTLSGCQILTERNG